MSGGQRADFYGGSELAKGEKGFERGGQALWRAALYIRLSREDGSDESYSVKNQRQRLSDYLERLILSEELEPVGCYIDAAAIIGLNQKPEANGRRFSPFSLVSAHFKANGGCNCLI